jgi:hypothetical protein
MTFIWPFEPDVQKGVMFMHKLTRKVIAPFLATTWGMFVDAAITFKPFQYQGKQCQNAACCEFATSW